MFTKILRLWLHIYVKQETGVSVIADSGLQRYHVLSRMKRRTRPPHQQTIACYMCIQFHCHKPKVVSMIRLPLANALRHLQRLQQEKTGGSQISQRRMIAQRIRRDALIQRDIRDVRPWTRYHERKRINRSVYSALYVPQILAADLLPEASCAAPVARHQPHKSILVVNGTLLYRPQTSHLYRMLADMYRMS
jgi:hypothetical protein